MKKVIIGVLFIIAVISCNTTKITTSWQAPGATAKKYNKIMVTGLINEPDRSIREKMENHLADDLRSLGYNVVTALTEYGPKAFENLGEKAVLQKLKSSNVDAVLTIVLLDKEKERSYQPVYSVQGNFWGYYGRYYYRLRESGYYVVNTKYYWESNFYDLDKGELLYSVQTNTFDPASSESLGHEYGKLIVKDMLSKKLLQDYTVKGPR